MFAFLSGKQTCCHTVAGPVCLEENGGGGHGAGHSVPPSIGKRGKGVCRLSLYLHTVKMRMKTVGETSEQQRFDG